MKNLSAILSLFISFLLVVSVAGIPVILNHDHNPTHNDELLTQENLSCEESNNCCETDSKEKEIYSNVCECNLLASCCCCFFEVQLVSFSYNTPIVAPIATPDFITLYTANLFSFSDSNSNFQNSIKANRLPPPKTYSQQLSIYQVFRI